MKIMEDIQAKIKRIFQARRIALLFLAGVVMFSGYSLAKYFVSKDQKISAEAKSFYFESDLLAVSTNAIPHYTLQAGVDDLTFSLMNYPDELRGSEVDISYTISLTKDGTEVQAQTGTINAGRNSVPIQFQNLSAGTYTVIANATNPYTQTLKGRFTVVNTNYELSCNVSDAVGSPNLKVTVTTTDYAGNIVISWPEGVLPDNTDPLMQNASGQSCTVEVNAQSEYTFQFFKTNPNVDYSENVVATKSNS